MQVYLEDRKAIAFYGSQADPDFWDDRWETRELERIIRGCRTDAVFIPAVKKYLPAGSVVLEGGCGMGNLVHALKHQGYNGIGIDFATRTVDAVRNAVPEIDVRAGDVRDLPLEDGSLDGYISGGVIEHFWGGYHPILREMARTIRSGGFLFISFPYMSPIRRLKARMRKYAISTSAKEETRSGSFYQFALEGAAVIRDLEALGFELREKKPFDGVKGFKDEVPMLRKPLSIVYSNPKLRLLKSAFNLLASPFSGHCVLLVFRKR